MTERILLLLLGEPFDGPPHVLLQAMGHDIRQLGSGFGEDLFLMVQPGSWTAEKGGGKERPYPRHFVLEGKIESKSLDHQVYAHILDSQDTVALRERTIPFKDFIEATKQTVQDNMELEEGFDAVVLMGVLDHEKASSEGDAQKYGVVDFLIDGTKLLPDDPSLRLSFVSCGHEWDLASLGADVSHLKFMFDPANIRSRLRSVIDADPHRANIFRFFQSRRGKSHGDMAMTCVLPCGVFGATGSVNFEILSQRPFIDTMQIARGKNAEGISPLYTTDPVLTALTGQYTDLQIRSSEFEHEIDAEHKHQPHHQQKQTKRRWFWGGAVEPGS